MKKHLYSFLGFLLALPAFGFSQDGGEGRSIDQAIDDFFGPITDFLNRVIFASFDFSIGGETISVPIVLVVLIGGALYFTFYFNFVNIRRFGLSLNIVRGKYSDPNESGEVSHFQALTTALSATVGLGNIAGVAVAISVGGPGATFWMIIAGLLGMSTKFVECTLGVKYREIGPDGTVYGGPMYYLTKGFANLKMMVGGKETNYQSSGKVLAVVFAIACIGGSFGGGNMFQVNQAYKQINNMVTNEIPADQVAGLVGTSIFDPADPVSEFKVKGVAGESVSVIEKNSGVASSIPVAEVSSKYVTKPLNSLGWLFGLVFAVLVGIVIIGGIKSIAKVTDKIVPFMVAVYVLSALIVIFANVTEIPAAFGKIFSGAFNNDAVIGGGIGVLIQGFRRAAFSNEAGVGSASIAHSAVKTNNPASEGLVALLEPFIDTVVVCTMTALVIVITGQYENFAGGGTEAGISLTSAAFASVISWFPYVLTMAVVLFAFSTMISWSYYGVQAWTFVFGRSKRQEYIYKAIFCLMVVVGAAASLGNVIGFSDAMIFAMVFPNIIGLIFLLPVVKHELKDYTGRIESGEIIRVK